VWKNSRFYDEDHLGLSDQMVIGPDQVTLQNVGLHKQITSTIRMKVSSFS
jgi:hypothetical protein